MILVPRFNNASVPADDAHTPGRMRSVLEYVIRCVLRN